MKHLAFTAFAAIAFAACTTTPKQENLSFDTATVEKTFKLDEKNANSPKTEIKMNVVFAKGDDARAKLINNAIEEQLFMLKNLSMQQAIDSFANTRGNEYINDFTELYKEVKNEEDKGAWYQCHYELKTRTEQKADTIVNYIAEQDTYDGGAHGLFIKSVINFSTNSGKQITLKDVLLPGYENKLNEILLDKLIKQTESKDINDLKEKGYLFNMDMAPSQFYIINDEGITFIYNQYEIAPYAVGLTELSLSWDELKEVAPKK